MKKGNFFKSSFLSFCFLGISSGRAEEIQSLHLKVCGQQGSLSERIADCQARNHEHALHESSTESEGKVAWVLVSENADATKDLVGSSWQDTKTGWVWEATQPETMNFEVALKTCGKNTLPRRLPEASDFETAERHGIRIVFQNEVAKKVFWTATPGGYKKSAFFYSGSGGYVDDGTRKESHSVKCITRQ